MLSKRHIKRSFSANALKYDRAASVQRNISNKLLSHIDKSLKNAVSNPSLWKGSILDIGCGTGYLTGKIKKKYPQTSVNALDLSSSMIKKAKETYPEIDFSQGDAEKLPYTDNSFDLVISASTYQWVENLEKAFKEVRRVLKPEGLFIFSVFGKNTLKELRNSYEYAYKKYFKSKKNIPVHKFISLGDLFDLLNNFQIIFIANEYLYTTTNKMETLIRRIKNLGAQNAHNNRPRGLGQRTVLKNTEKYYKENFSTDNGDLIVTWEALYCKTQIGITRHSRAKDA